MPHDLLKHPVSEQVLPQARDLLEKTRTLMRDVGMRVSSAQQAHGKGTTRKSKGKGGKSKAKK